MFLKLLALLLLCRRLVHELLDPAPHLEDPPGQVAGSPGKLLRLCPAFLCPCGLPLYALAQG